MNLQHHFLIAMPALHDSVFAQTVIYICKHDAKGAMGLVINRPSQDVTILELLTRLGLPLPADLSSAALHSPVLLGGPLSEDHGFILHSPNQMFTDSINISSDITLSTSKAVLTTFSSGQQPTELLVTLGYAGWDAGQLEQEILNNLWLTVEADVQTLFHSPFAERWQHAAKKLGVDIRTIATHAGRA